MQQLPCASAAPSTKLCADHCPEERTAPYKSELLAEYRTANRNTKLDSPEDIWRFQPWRSPGKAPVSGESGSTSLSDGFWRPASHPSLSSDPCGMAGGSPVPGINGGEYTTTEHVDANGKPYTLKQGDLGSHALKKRPSGVVWKSGGLANVSWYIAFVSTARSATTLSSTLTHLLPTESWRRV